MSADSKKLYKKHEKTFIAMGTVNALTVFCKDTCAHFDQAEGALKKAAAKVNELEDRLSVFKEGSDISRVNRSAGIRPQKVCRETFELLLRAKNFSALSGGAFDITTRPLSNLWNFGKKDCQTAEQKEVKKAMRLVNYRDLILDESNLTAFLHRTEQSVDLGGIAKGYAADEVKRILRECGIKSALINLGGNIVTLGTRPDGEDWHIGIQNPLAERGQFIGTIPVREGTVVTSGSNERFYMKNGIRYHHILDPRTGCPVQNGLLSVTVLCENSADADALTTALFVLGPEKSDPLLRATGAQAAFITEKLDLFMTGDMMRQFEPAELKKRICI